MKKTVIFIIMMIMMLVACGPSKKASSSYSYSNMYFTLNTTYCQYQVDSMIDADTLAPLNRWNASFLWSSSGQQMMQYVFIKEKLTYTVTQLKPQDTVYKTTKRKIE